MSRQSKSAKNKARAQAFTKVRQGGGKSSNPGEKHGKDYRNRVTYRMGADYAKRMEQFLKGSSVKSARGTAGGNKILQGAGSAAA